MLNNWYSRWICEFPSDGLSPINLTPMISLRQSFVSWVLPETQSSVLTPFPGILGKISWSWYIGFNWCFMVSWQLDAVYFPVDTGRKLNLLMHVQFMSCIYRVKISVIETVWMKVLLCDNPGSGRSSYVNIFRDCWSQGSKLRYVD